MPSGYSKPSALPDTPNASKPNTAGNGTKSVAGPTT
jgi:hypothetical protein